MTLDFRSDNTGSAAPEVLAALAAATASTAQAYGTDDWTARLQARFSELFEAPVQVIPVSTGTAANALAVAAITPSWGAVYCSQDAHIETSEVHAASFMSGGAKLRLVAGPHGKIDPEALEAALAGAGKGLQHKSQPAALNLVQTTDLGALYKLDEVRALTSIAKAHDLRVHMDGARLANALASLGCTPAELTWKSGVDILSFGCTKNGGMLADAIVVFRPELAEALKYQVRRAGQVWSKMRYASAQLLAYVEDGLWLKLAGRANAAAARIRDGIRDLPGVKLHAPIEGNMIFVELSPAAMQGLERDGVIFARRGPSIARFVCRWDVTAAEVDGLLASLRRHAGAKAA